MIDAERYWVVATGAVGLVAFAGGSLLTAVPPLDSPPGEVAALVERRRTSLLAGSVLSVAGCGLLLWPIAAVASSSSPHVWRSLALFSVAVAVLGFACLAFAAVMVAAVAWRDPAQAEPGATRLFLDASHLAIWAVSAPIGAVLVSATTAVGIQSHVLGPIAVVAAVAKVITVIIEVAGTGRRAGWNAGGWAAGSSGYVTAIWFALLLVYLY